MHKELKGWVEWLGIENPELEALCGDASSRRYYRLKEPQSIVMDASELKESVPRFIGVAMLLQQMNVRLPQIKAFEQHKGFILLEDIGSTHLFEKIQSPQRSTYYDKAIEELAKIQKTPAKGLEPYDNTFLLDEMNLMPQWYLKAYLGKKVECMEGRILLESFMFIIKEVLSQPQDIFVHRDYHSRNLMIDAHDEIVVIDFQDAKSGALTYDLVSLLRDVYVELEEDEVKRLVQKFKELKGLEVDDATFMRWFDFTGLQRHIKILGIFARLSIRDGKDTYLKDIPLTLKYILKVGAKYPELDGLVNLLKSV